MKKLLIVVDMQNDFLTGSLKANDGVLIIDGIKELIMTYKLNGDDVIFTKDTHDEGYLNTLEGKNLPIPHCIKNTKGWEICDELKDLNYGTFFEKTSFGSISLFEMIKEKYHDLEEIAFCGVCTDICVISNAIIAKAFFPEVNIVIYEGLCKGVTKETHSSAIKVLSACQCIIK